MMLATAALADADTLISKLLAEVDARLVAFTHCHDQSLIAFLRPAAHPRATRPLFVFTERHRL